MTGRAGRVRTWLLARLPASLMEYPFEAFAAVYGTLAGALVVLSGQGVPPRTDALLPDLVIRLWGATLLVAGVTLLVGLRRRWRLALPVGLRLLGVSLGIFCGVVVWTERTWEVVPGAVLIAFIALLALARGIFLRAATEVRHRARVERGG